MWTPGSEEEGPGAWTLALTEQGLGAQAGVGSGLAALGPAVGSVTTLPLVMGPQVVKETCGTGRVAGARRQLRTPTSAYVSDAATATGSATTSVRMVRGEPGPRGGAGGGQPLGLTAARSAQRTCGGSTCGRWAGRVEASSSSSAASACSGEWGSARAGAPHPGVGAGGRRG